MVLCGGFLVNVHWCWFFGSWVGSSWIMVSGVWVGVNGWWCLNNGQWCLGSGQWLMVIG